MSENPKMVEAQPGSHPKDVHTEHCCAKHGCKYGQPECPVANGQKPQSFPCEDCQWEAKHRPELQDLAKLRGVLEELCIPIGATEPVDVAIIAIRELAELRTLAQRHFERARSAGLQWFIVFRGTDSIDWTKRIVTLLHLDQPAEKPTAPPRVGKILCGDPQCDECHPATNPSDAKGAK